MSCTKILNHSKPVPVCVRGLRSDVVEAKPLRSERCSVSKQLISESETISYWKSVDIFHLLQNAFLCPIIKNRRNGRNIRFSNKAGAFRDRTRRKIKNA